MGCRALIWVQGEPAATYTAGGWTVEQLLCRLHELSPLCVERVTEAEWQRTGGRAHTVQLRGGELQGEDMARQMGCDRGLVVVTAQGVVVREPLPLGYDPYAPVGQRDRRRSHPWRQGRRT